MMPRNKELTVKARAGSQAKPLQRPLVMVQIQLCNLTTQRTQATWYDGQDR